ncbi:MAG: IPT/TIG domain-containing protein [Hymenobacteraceae bacterium]|nr:IPT/TIG domain-containing protein [Hymenobacteraceae bacterium]
MHTLPTLGRGHGNGYAAKLTNRVWEWAVNITGGGVSELNDLKVDSRGNAYVLSTLEGNRLFVGADTVIGPMTSAGYQGFVAKLSPQGQLRWGVSISSEFDTYVRGVALDSGKLFVTGGVAGDSLRFGPFALNQITDQGFTAALDTAGNWRWAIAQGGALTVDLRHQLDYTGAFADSLILGSLRLTNPYPQSSGAFVAQLAAPAFIHRFSPSAGPAGTLVTLTGVGFASTTAVYFGGVAATFTVLSNGQVQVVVPPGLPTTGPGVLIQIVGPNGTSLSGTRFGGRPTGLTAALVAPHFYLVPNPAHDQVRLVSLPATASTVQVLDALGRVVRTQPAAARSLDVRGLPAGVYVVRAGASTRRLVVE